ncbi:hypothetical protein [Borreliella mayonii]|nr:hypothetical protein [Borreliella mayonii]
MLVLKYRQQILSSLTSIQKLKEVKAINPKGLKFKNAMKTLKVIK